MNRGDGRRFLHTFSYADKCQDRARVVFRINLQIVFQSFDVEYVFQPDLNEFIVSFT